MVPNLRKGALRWKPNLTSYFVGIDLHKEVIRVCVLDSRGGTKNATVRQWAAPMLRRIHRSKVRIALARRLLIGVYFMLRNDEPFNLDRCLGLSDRA